MKKRVYTLYRVSTKGRQTLQRAKTDHETGAADNKTG